MGIHRIGRSQLGAARRSQLGVLTLGGVEDTLLWGYDASESGAFSAMTMNDTKSVLEDLGSTVHDHTDWSETVGDYGLIIFLLPISDPSWWSDIQSDWVGRIHLCGEYDSSSFNAANAHINTKTALTGMSIVEAEIDILDGPHAGPIEANALTAGLTALWYAATSKVSGGTALSKTKDDGDDPGQIWIARNKSGTVDWVLSGDTNHITDPEDLAANANRNFVENLLTVGI